MLRKILLPLDGSEFAEQSLPYATALAEKCQAELLVVRVVHPMPIISDYSAAVYEAYLTAEQYATEDYLQNLKTRLADVSFPVHFVSLHDAAVAEAIIDYACREKIDLVVMSTHGRSGVGRWIHGSVTSKVLHHAPCPVLLVRAVHIDQPEATDQPAQHSEPVAD